MTRAAPPFYLTVYDTPYRDGDTRACSVHALPPGAGGPPEATICVFRPHSGPPERLYVSLRVGRGGRIELVFLGTRDAAGDITLAEVTRYGGRGGRRVLPKPDAVRAAVGAAFDRLLELDALGLRAGEYTLAEWP